MPPPGSIKLSHKKDGGYIDFMFLAPPLYPAAGSATVIQFAYYFPRQKLHKDLVMHKLVHSAVFVFRRTQVQVCISFLQPTSDLLGLIQVLAIVFGEEPPVFSRSASRPQPPPYPAAGATPYPATGK